MINPIPTSPLKAIIVDDETHARAALEGMIRKNFAYIQVVDKVASVPEAVKSIHKHTPDIVLLDIEMPHYLGIDLLDFLNKEEINFSIIFVTAYNEYALKAFSMAAVDYILKPTKLEDLQRAFERVLKQHQTQKLSSESYQERYFVLKDNLEHRKTNRIAFQTAEGVQFFRLEEILYLKADSSYTHIFLENNQKITVSKTLQEYNSLEETGNFMRVSRSYIINLHQVEKISKKEGGFVLMKNQEEISLSSEKRQLLYEKYGKIIF